MDVAGLRDVKETGRHRSLIRRLDDGHDIVVTFRPVRAGNLEATRLIRFADCGSATDRILDRFVHHVNTPELIAGVATMSLEIIEDLPDVDVIVTPICGGSASVGHCLVAKALKPAVQVIGVQAAGAPAVYRSWRERALQQAPINTAAEGLATGHAYYAPARVFIEHMDDMLLVSEEELRSAMLLLARTAYVVAEESGAAAAAAAVQAAGRLRGKKVAIVVSGGNITTDHLRRVFLDAKG